MLCKIYDSLEDGSLRYTFINPDRIEAITKSMKDIGVVKIHLANGKEYRADVQSLHVLKNYLDVDNL